MEFLQLKYFLAVADEQSLSRTASQLYISPPSLSATITRLEKELNCTLFDRTPGHRMTLNENGQIFYKAVEKALGILDDARTQISDLEKARNCSISVAATSPMIWIDLFLAFSQVYPNVSITHTFLNLDQIQALDKSVKYDVILASPDDMVSESLASQVLYSNDKPMLAVYREHRLAGREAVDMDEVRNEPFILITRDFSSRRFSDLLFGAAGFSPNVFTECDYVMRTKMIQSGQGVGIVTQHSAQCNPDPNISYIQISKPMIRRAQAIYWNPNRYQTEASVNFKLFAEKFFEGKYTE